MKKISIACMVAVAGTAVFGENEGMKGQSLLIQ